jgi:WhiB family redox-sensing transcriptional regulator
VATYQPQFPAGAVTPVPLGPWARQAECASPGTDLSIFFSASPALMTRAKAVCARCRVRSQCLEYALAVPEKSGVWGGLDETERGHARRRRRRADSCPKKNAA